MPVSVTRPKPKGTADLNLSLEYRGHQPDKAKSFAISLDDAFMLTNAFRDIPKWIRLIATNAENQISSTTNCTKPSVSNGSLAVDEYTA